MVRLLAITGFHCQLCNTWYLVGHIMEARPEIAKLKMELQTVANIMPAELRSLQSELRRLQSELRSLQSELRRLESKLNLLLACTRVLFVIVMAILVRVLIFKYRQW
ncbi:hypothetical protein L2E82_16618 [Cichorium intybus]|uniref:Uncharacterized protein n=1 Tax=Cichorium intybus TaxID=13427 RepID=A0ACB9F5J4_CICIN|nr:hypothetical protein L2E82_16618 [Cichorium intybus]